VLLVISKLRSWEDNSEHTVILVDLHGLHTRPHFYFAKTPKVYETSIVFPVGWSGLADPSVAANYITGYSDTVDRAQISVFGLPDTVSGANTYFRNWRCPGYN
jgi:hypothetical protein